MSHEFLLPDLGEGLTEAEVVGWFVAVGDEVTVDQPVVEVESAKSVVELPCPYAGTVERLNVEPGQTVEKGMALLTIAVPDDAGLPDGAPDDAPHEPADVETVPGTALRGEPSATGSGAVLVGYGTRETNLRLKRPTTGRFHARSTAGSMAPASASASARTLIDPTRHSPVQSPIVRQRARAHGFDATNLAGSGPGSLVRREDVDAAIAELAASTGTDPASAPQPVQPGDDARRTDEDRRIPLTGVRKIIATHLSESRRKIPEATIWRDVDATGLFVARDRLQRATGERFSLTTLLARFAVAGLRKFPVLNASVDEDAEVIVQHAAINLGIAAQTSRGLMVPVIHGAQDLTTRGLRDRVASLVEASKDGDYSPHELTGGTFTLNNYGGFGVDGSTPIINYPEVAMLGVGRIMDRPWAVDGELAVRKVVTLSFVFDHRVCDGAEASGFLTFVAGCVEEPLLLLDGV